MNSRSKAERKRNTESGDEKSEPWAMCKRAMFLDKRHAERRCKEEHPKLCNNLVLLPHVSFEVVGFEVCKSTLDQSSVVIKDDCFVSNTPIL